jgi:ATP-dependent Clp protease ATP-binding subunit ClpA
MSLSYRLLKRYYPYESFPGKGIKFLGQCLNETQLNQEITIDRKVVIDNFVKQTGLPEMLLRDDLLLDTQELSEYFNKRIIGQKMAVDKLCETVKIFKAGLNNPFKPISTILFAGPTGVGKTASAKALADYFFGKGQVQSPLVRIDMSEFQHPSQITRLVGSGREVGQLVKEIRDKPFSVLLLDEVEKADISIFDALLTVLDEGLLVDAYGRTTNFRNTIIIMTSNLGASNQKSIGYVQTTNPQDQYRSAIERHFRPEFVNRIDNIILFNSLSQEDITLIAKKELEELKKREGFLKRNLNIHFSEQVIQHLSIIGFDERYGARPLQRAVEQALVNPIASWLLEHPDIHNKDIWIDYNGTLIING